MKVIDTKSDAESPQGAPFFVDRCRFTPTQGIEISSLQLDDDKVQNWPMVYILANDNPRQKSAYVGRLQVLASVCLSIVKTPKKIYLPA